MSKLLSKMDEAWEESESLYGIMNQIRYRKRVCRNILKDHAFSTQDVANSYQKYLHVLQDDLLCAAWSKNGEQFIMGNGNSKICIIENYSNVKDEKPIMKRVSNHIQDAVVNLKFLDSEKFIVGRKKLKTVSVLTCAKSIQDYSCASSGNHCIATFSDDQNIFWTADSNVVRQYDIRERHRCNNEPCRNVMVGFQRDNRIDVGAYKVDIPVYQSTRNLIYDAYIRHICHKTESYSSIRNNRQSEIGRLFISANPCYPYYVGLCGVDVFTRIYDRRMMRPEKITERISLKSIAPCDVFFPKNLWKFYPYFDFSYKDCESYRLAWSPNGNHLATSVKQGDIYIFDFKNSHSKNKSNEITENISKYNNRTNFFMNILYPTSVKKEDVKKAFLEYHKKSKTSNLPSEEDPLYTSEVKKVKDETEEATSLYHSSRYQEALVLFKRCLDMVTHKDLRKVYYFDLAKTMKRIDTKTAQLMVEYYLTEALKLDPTFEEAIVLRIKTLWNSNDLSALAQAFLVCLSALIHFKNKKFKNLLKNIVLEISASDDNTHPNVLRSKKRLPGGYEYYDDEGNFLNPYTGFSEVFTFINETLMNLRIVMQESREEYEFLLKSIFSSSKKNICMYARAMFIVFPDYLYDLFRDIFLHTMDPRISLRDIVSARLRILHENKWIHIKDLSVIKNNKNNFFFYETFSSLKYFFYSIQIRMDISDPHVSSRISNSKWRAYLSEELTDYDMKFYNEFAIDNIETFLEGRLVHSDDMLIIPKIFYEEVEEKEDLESDNPSKLPRQKSFTEDSDITNPQESYNNKIIQTINIPEIWDHKTHEQICNELGSPTWVPIGDFSNIILPYHVCDSLVDFSFLSNNVLLIVYQHNLVGRRISDGELMMMHPFKDKIRCLEIHPEKYYIAVGTYDVSMLKLGYPEKQSHVYYTRI